MCLNISYILNLNQTNFQKKFLFKNQENNVNNNSEFLWNIFIEGSSIW